MLFLTYSEVEGLENKNFTLLFGLRLFSVYIFRITVKMKKSFSITVL